MIEDDTFSCFVDEYYEPDFDPYGSIYENYPLLSE